MKRTIQIACPMCDKDVNMSIQSKLETIIVRGDKIKVNAESLLCPNCGSEFGDEKYVSDPLDLAYCEYRRKHNMMQPEEIRALRKSYGLTQKELAALLGFGEVTLSRYERGSLQDDAHDTALQFLKNPANLKSLVERKHYILSPQRTAKILKSLKPSRRKKPESHALSVREQESRYRRVARKNKKS